jgi:DNA-binding HxlR family transcriptional regulator
VASSIGTRIVPPASTESDIDAEACRAFQGTLESIGRRWTGAILLAATRGACRFGEYRRMVPGISDRLLSQRLKELEGLGLIEREVVPTTPVQVLYRPSQQGSALMAAMQPLVQWGVRHGVPPSGAR